MDASPTHNSDRRVPLGMDSFGPEDQQHFGRNIRLAMACIEGDVQPINAKAIPTDEAALRQRLRSLTQEMSSSQADLLELLTRFDEIEGWKSSGARHWAAWMNTEIGIGLKLSWEYLRVGRCLRSLPTTRALFWAGKLTWSKVRLLVGVANLDNEKILCHAALDASVSELARICNEYKWNEDNKEDGDKKRAIEQWKSRSLLWGETSNGSTCIRLTLPPEIARAFLKCVEHSLNQLGESESEDSISQRRADAAVLMAESSLQAAGREFATADRYQVIVSVEAEELQTSNNDRTPSKKSTPSKRPTVTGAGAIAHETARRIACDCSVTTNTIANGEPTDIGRKSRIWPAAMARAIKDRDQHCQFYGCTQTRHLQVHHIDHWADGGSTRVENGVSVCASCHQKLHEGGYRIQRVDNDEQRLNEQFEQQQNADDKTMFDFEADLRNDRESFDKIRKLSPTRYRFRVIDAEGRDIRHRFTVKANTSYPEADTESETSNNFKQSTRVDCAEPAPGGYGFKKSADTKHTPWFTTEQSAVYHVSTHYR
ncbi:MAG: DUF222 domain-containing protein [Granulosicoccus sp.]